MSIPEGLIWRSEFFPQQGEGTGVSPSSATQEQQPVGSQADGTLGGEAQGQGGLGCGTEQILLMVGMVVIFYLLLIRPQQKQEKVKKAMMAALQKGDRVVTNGGIHGTVTKVEENLVTLKMDQEGKQKITFDRSAIGRVASGETAKIEGSSK